VKSNGYEETEHSLPNSNNIVKLNGVIYRLTLNGKKPGLADVTTIK